MVGRLQAAIERGRRAVAGLLATGQGVLGVLLVSGGVTWNWGYGWGAIVLGGFVLLGAVLGGA